MMVNPIDMLKRFLMTANNMPQIRLPNFIIIGANKAGTTSLFYYLRQHPDIFMPAIKEPMFFNSAQEGAKLKDATLADPYRCFTLKQYSELFSQANEPIIGEASTAYLANPECALWIKKIIPEVKIIAMLRNPLDRAVSNYKMYYANGIEKRTFQEAIIHELEMGVVGLPRGQWYLALGLYASQLSQFKRYFPPEQIYVGDYDDYNADNTAYLKRIFGFLGVRDLPPTTIVRKNVSDIRGEEQVKIEIDVQLESKITKYFSDDIHKLQSMVDFDVMKWLKS